MIISCETELVWMPHDPIDDPHWYVWWFDACRFYPKLLGWLHWPWWRHQWKHFSRYWRFVQGIHRSPVKSPHKGQWRGALTLSLIRAWINGWVNNCEAGDLRRHRAHYDVNVMTGAITRLFKWKTFVQYELIIYMYMALSSILCMTGGSMHVLVMGAIFVCSGTCNNSGAWVTNKFMTKSILIRKYLLIDFWLPQIRGHV